MSRGRAWAMVVLFGGLLGGGAFLVLRPHAEPVRESGPVSATTSTISSPPSTTIETRPTGTVTEPPAAATTTTVQVRKPDSVPSWTVGHPWGVVDGITMFRGNPTRTYHGNATPSLGGVPTISWTYPDEPMCRTSSSGGEVKVWCGMGWTGQPAVWTRPDGKTEVIFGAYDGSVHFVDGTTGEELRPSFQTGDIIKGSVTLDPDGYPLLYFGSRDNLFRILALDREPPELLWALDANEVRGIWNNDWDGNPVIVDDVLYEGGENGWFFAYALNRSYSDDGFVEVQPELLVAMPGYNDELLSKSGRNVSIESSVAVFEQRVYFANSGGRVVGLDVSDVRSGNAPIVFDYYAGGDIDSTIVVDEAGHLYVSIEHEPSQMGSVERERNLEVGQLIKLDPYAKGDPRLWGVDLTDGFDDAGIWATPALYQEWLLVNTHNGDLIMVDRDTGEVVWSDEVGWHSWSSPVVVGEALIVATCTGELRGYRLGNPPSLAWTVNLGGSCLEATPAVHNGTIYLGSRDGFMRAIR